MQKKPKRFVEIIWTDIISNATWHDHEDICTPAVMTTRGWLVKETPDWVCVCASMEIAGDEVRQIGDSISIPRGVIKSMKNVGG